MGPLATLELASELELTIKLELVSELELIIELELIEELELLLFTLGESLPEPPQAVSKVLNRMGMVK